jgi:hypothetical protein
MKKSTKRKIERANRRNECSRKVNLKSEAHAEKVLIEQRLKLETLNQLKRANRLNVYKCGYCDYWHIGKSR